MNAYVDASAFVRILLLEPDAEAALACWRAAEEGYVSEIGYLEVRASLAAARRSGRTWGPDAEHDHALANELWEEVVEVTLDAAVMAEAVRVAVDRGLRTLDAIHLASALIVKGDEPLAFVSFDLRLRAAAAAEGFVVLPEAA
ncbi:MAG: type II toxin-antitoxin system VapC family toxin [Chloroflexota bacterium]